MFFVAARVIMNATTVGRGRCAGDALIRWFSRHNASMNRSIPLFVYS